MEFDSSPPEPLRRPEIPGPGTRLADRYELVRVVGRGGRGVVYRASDPVLGRDVAVKLVPAAMDDASAEARFQREAHVVARMDHPHIVPIYDFGRHGQTLFYVMPLLEGGSLRRRLADGELSLGDVVEVGAQVAAALDYSHGHGVVHRDIKPENILYSKEAGVVRVRVTDFGLAHDRAGKRLTETHQLPGTLAYLSPEQVSGPEVDGRADLYALGVVLYESLVGATPFEGAPFSVLYRIVNEPAVPVARRVSGIDTELAALVDRCLSKNPSGRPLSGREIEEQMRAIHERLDIGQRERALEPVARRSGSPKEAALVGRDDEALRLHDHFDGSLGGKCHLVLIGGDAGTGKSRLLQELEGWSLVRGVRVLRGHFSADDRTFPYQGLCELIQDYFRSRRTSSSSSGGGHGRVAGADQVVSAGFGPDLADLAPELLHLFPQLQEIPELRGAEKTSIGDVPEPQDDGPRTGANRVFELIARTLARLGDGRPLVLMLESLHHGEVAVAALRYLVPRLAATPTLVVATYRPAEVDRSHPLSDLVRQFSDDPRFGRIDLSNLGRDALAALLGNLLGSAALSDSAVNRIFDVTEGNPLFVCELVASLRESGELSRDPSGLWRLRTDVGALTHGLPATLQQAAETRLLRLDDEGRRLLSVASVFGRSFDLDDLVAVILRRRGLVPEDGERQGTDDDVDRQVDELVASGLLEENAALRGEWLRFVSSAVRELLYRDLSRRSRRTLHRIIAEHLETRHQGNTDRALPQLVHHFSRADRAAETVRYALQLARRSLLAFSPEDALQAVRTALEWVDDEAVEETERVQAELLFVGARAQRSLGDLDGALRRAEAACDLFVACDASDEAARVALMVAEAAWQGRRVKDARVWVDRGAQLARTSSAPASVLHRLLTLGGTLANLRGDSARAKAYLDEAESLPSTDPAPESPIPCGGTLRVALANPIPELVPGQLETDEAAEVAANVFETLIVAEDEGRLRPGLCSEWRSFPDARIFRLHLDPEASFSDGTAVTAEVAKASLEASARAGFGRLAPGFFDAIEGMSNWLRGAGGNDAAEGVDGLRVLDERTLEARLTEPLPIFPVLLTDCRAAIAKPSDGGWLGSGPFLVSEVVKGRVVLERNNRYWRGTPAHVDRLEFHSGLGSARVAAALHSGEIDLARDLMPEDLEGFLRRPSWRSGLVETTRKNIYFVLFHSNGPTSRHAGVRRALTGLVWAQDLVWRTLGRFAHPAVSLIPPGVLGHDPGRRPERLQRARARILLEGADQPLPLRLRAAVHPVLQDRYSALLNALFAEWRSLGVEVEVANSDMDGFLRAYRRPEEFDLLVARWNADYDDPDNFTYNILHSRAGILRRWVPGGGADTDDGGTDDSWAECDGLLERARREADPRLRLALYRRFEDAVYRRHVLLPLFHDVDYRLTAPRVRGVSLGTTYPYVGYAKLGVVAAEDVAAREPQPSSSMGGLHVPISGPLDTLDPSEAFTFEALEVVGNVFETLTRLDRSARIVPWLASSLEAEDGGRRYRFRLRPGLRFQDGRPCTSRDVRHSFERLLRRVPPSPSSRCCPFEVRAS